MPRFNPGEFEIVGGKTFLPGEFEVIPEEKPVQEQGVTFPERTFIQNFAPNPQSAIKWLQTKPGEGGKPENLGLTYTDILNFVTPGLGATARTVGQWLGFKDKIAVPIPGLETHQYEAKQYGPGNRIMVRPMGSSEPFRVVDPDTGLFGDVVGDVSDIGYSALTAPMRAAGAAGGPIGYGALQAGTEAARQSIASSRGLEGSFEPGSIAIHGVASTALDALLPKVGKLLKAPESAYQNITRNTEKEALKLARENKAYQEGLKAAAQEEFIGEIGKRTVAANAKVAKEGIATPVSQLKSMTAEEVKSAMQKQYDSKIRFLSNLIHPATGIKAQYLDYVPEFVSISNKWIPNFITKYGSKAMPNRASTIKALETEIPQNVADEVSVGFGKDLAKWMISDERSNLIDIAEREALKRLARGEAQLGDDLVVNKILNRIIENSAPKLGAAKTASEAASRQVKIALGNLKRPPTTDLDVISKWIRDNKSAIESNLRGTDIGVALKLSALPFRAASKTSSFIGDLLQKTAAKSPQQLAMLAQKAPPGIRRELLKAVRMAELHGPDAFYIALNEILRIPGVMDFLKKED